MIVYVNGSYVDEKDAMISVFDRGFIFGDGVYEVLPIIEGVMVDVAPFYERLERSMSEMRLEANFTREELKNILDTVIEKNEITEGGIYMQVTRGVAPRDFAFPKDTPTTLVAFAFPKTLIENPLAKSGVEVVSVDDIRWKRRDVKSTALLAQCLAKQSAREQGAFEGIMVEDGMVTEGTSSSLYIIKNGKIITRPLSNSILPGIRRKVLLSLAKEEGIQIEERTFSVEEAQNADEMFMSSATTFVLPIISVDGVKVNDGKPGSVAAKMRAMYIKAVQEEAAEALAN